MAVPPREPRLSKEQRHALALLPSIPYGVTEDVLVLAHGFDRAMIAGLVHEGLATAHREIVTGTGRTVIEVVRIRITDAGRMATATEPSPRPPADQWAAFLPRNVGAAAGVGLAREAS